MATRRPAPALRPYVRGLGGYTERTPGTLRRPEFPGPFVVIVLKFGPPVRLAGLEDAPRWSRHPGGFVAGIDDRPTLTEHDGFQQGVQVNLTPIGARLFFDMPMSELAGRIVSVRDVLPKEQSELTERLQELPSWDSRLDLVERILSDRIYEARAETRALSWAVRRIQECGGSIKIRGLARELGCSRKHLIQLFRRDVGIAPKLLARIVRFDGLIQRIRAGAAGTWADLALEFGYYDQAHLVRDVRQFTGTTPTEVRASLVDLGLDA